MNYWGYRINKAKNRFFADELNQGRLRQGWGYKKEHDLTKPQTDSNGKRNKPIYNKVKKGDILLIPYCPTWSEITIAEATEDFDIGYRFEIDSDLKDYGHIFPARKIKSFVRDNENVSGGIRASLKTRSRFWNMNSYANDIQNLLKTDQSKLTDKQSRKNRYKDSISNAFDNSFNVDAFVESFYDNLVKNFSHAEWEFALVEGLRAMLPEPILVERTGGGNEKNHGCDIMIKYPGLLGITYVVGIQVKDYHRDDVSNYPVKQVSKIDNYFDDDENMKLIDKYLIITKVEQKDHEDLEQYAKENNVTIIFEEQLKELLLQIGKSTLGLSQFEY